MQFQGLVLALAVGAAGLFAAPASAHDRALVVGVNEYPGIISDGKPGGRNLSGAVPDAKTFVSLLVDVFKFDPGDIKLLTDGEATRANILASFKDWLTDGSGPGDRVVFYYAGHGATAAVEDAPGHKRLTSTIVPSDVRGDLDKPGAPIVGMIEGKAIGALVAKLDGRRVMVVADSCQSGSVTRGLFGAAHPHAKPRTISEHVPVGMTDDEITRSIQVEAKTANRLFDASELHTGPSELDVWSAATIQQVTFDLPDGSGGIFTQSFARGLRDKQAAHAPQTEVTGGNLLQFVRGQADLFCKSEPGCKAGLTPELQAPASYLTSILNPFPVPQAAAESTAADNSTSAEQKKPANSPPVAQNTPTAPPVEQNANSPPVGQNTPTNAPSVAHDAPSSGTELANDATNLFTHHNDFALSAEILPSARVRQGEIVKFRVTSGAPGTLMIIDIGPSGKQTQVFTNARAEQEHKNGHIRRDAPITIPDASYGFAFTASNPGQGKLIVLVAEEGVDLSEVLGRNLDFKPMSDSRSIVVEVAQKLDAPKLSPDLSVPNGSHHFAFVTAPYEVLP